MSYSSPTGYTTEQLLRLSAAALFDERPDDENIAVECKLEENGVDGAEATLKWRIRVGEGDMALSVALVRVGTPPLACRLGPKAPAAGSVRA